MPGDLDLRLQPDFSSTLVILRALANVNVGAFFVQGVVAMKPEDEVALAANGRITSAAPPGSDCWTDRRITAHAF
ncbi:MAG TPA: hypothetical protein DEP84_06835 [Chloroflexi bacterium]|nr:hypothetical protein [Chloroflexota bacterium]